ncbi:2-aminoethylphosphonate--pyruvate transaminase-like isoform X1 [Apostichopus japonicus]|uniref:2-aminoethylphosphonate--pyruvate transaminase-like isoform X1 n=2 Tax=Stichopus japonicus TaxID=307972 RepID=UPI003AB531E3
MEKGGNLTTFNGTGSPSAYPADKKLFTPGPLTTSATVKSVMLRDVGSRCEEMKSNTSWIRQKLVEIAGVSSDKYTCVPLQGSGSYTVEAVLNTTSKKDNARVLIIVNGRYGRRMMSMCEYMGVEVHPLFIDETEAVTGEMVRIFLQKDKNWTSVAIVHSETSSGTVNNVEEVGQLVKKECPGTFYIVDAMSSFGAIPLDMESGQIDFVVSSANKCLEGVPGFGYTICRKDILLQCKGRATSLCLDLVDQYVRLEETGHFRFTQPTHCLLAFRQAIEEFLKEGGVNGRAKRYKELHRILCDGMEQLGFKRYIPGKCQGYIITTFMSPQHENWSFETFNNRLLALGQSIYPGSTTKIKNTFRIGSIGRLFPDDMSHLIDCIKKVLSEMDIPVPVS